MSPGTRLPAWLWKTVKRPSALSEVPTQVLLACWPWWPRLTRLVRNVPRYKYGVEAVDDGTLRFRNLGKYDDGV